METPSHWQVQMTEVVHREALKLRIAPEIQPGNDLGHLTASRQSANALGRNWNSQIAGSGDDCLQLTF